LSKLISIDPYKFGWTNKNQNQNYIISYENL
jgi:hypothetical protein